MAEARANVDLSDELNRTSIAESVMPYKIPSDMSKIHYNASEEQVGLTELIRTIRDTGLENEELNYAVGTAVGRFAADPRTTIRKVELSEEPDPYSKFDMTKLTQSISLETENGLRCIGDFYDENTRTSGEFRKLSFKSDYDKLIAKDRLLDIAILTASHTAIPQGANEQESAANKNSRNNLIKDLILEKSKINIAQVNRANEMAIEKRIRSNLIRQSTVPQTLNSLIAPPKLGTKEIIPTSARASLRKIFNNVNFGSPGCSTPLREYLIILKNCISDVYNETAAYTLIESLMDGHAKDTVKSDRILKTSLQECWVNLQLTYNTSLSPDEATAKLRKLVVNRPSNPCKTITAIRNVLVEKNGLLKSEDRIKISNIEGPILILNFLKLWFPSYHGLIASSFAKITAEAKSNNVEVENPFLQLNMLVREHIGNSPAIPQKLAEMNALQIENLTGFHTSDKEVSQDFKHFAIQNAQTSGNALPSIGVSGNVPMLENNSVKNYGPPSVQLDAFQSGQNNQFQRGGNNFNSGGNRPKGGQRWNKLPLRDIHKNRCYRCGSNDGHKSNVCPQYPPGPLSDQECPYCQFFHQKNVECKAIRSNMNPVENPMSVQNPMFVPNQMSAQNSMSVHGPAGNELTYERPAGNGHNGQ